MPRLSIYISDNSYSLSLLVLEGYIYAKVIRLHLRIIAYSAGIAFGVDVLHQSVTLGESQQIIAVDIETHPVDSRLFCQDFRKRVSQFQGFQAQVTCVVQ